MFRLALSLMIVSHFTFAFAHDDHQTNGWNEFDLEDQQQVAEVDHSGHAHAQESTPFYLDPSVQIPVAIVATAAVLKFWPAGRQQAWYYTAAFLAAAAPFMPGLIANAIGHMFGVPVGPVVCVATGGTVCTCGH